MHNFLPYIACWINRRTFYFSPKSVLKKLNLFQVIGSLDHTCVFFGFRLTTLHPRLPSSICPFCPWTDIGPLHHPWDIWGKGKISYGVSWKIDWISQLVFESKTSLVKAFKIIWVYSPRNIFLKKPAIFVKWLKSNKECSLASPHLILSGNLLCRYLLDWAELGGASEIIFVTLEHT